MAESILTSTKAGLGVPESHTAFDVELTIFVNSVLSRLTSLGVGPAEGFSITGTTETWDDFLGADHPKFNNAKSYMVLRVKLMFDPPEIGFVLTAMKEMIEKDEWLLMVEADPKAEILEEDPLVWIAQPNSLESDEMTSGEIAIDPVTGDVWRKR